MEVKETELSKSLSIIYQPHPVVPVNGRHELVGVIEEGTTVREILLKAGVDPYQPIIITLDDRMLTVEEWDTVCPSNGQILNVQASVEGGGGDSNPLQIVLAIALVVVAATLPGLGPALFSIGSTTITVGTIAAAAIAVGGSLLLTALFPPKTPSDVSGRGEEVSPTYSLSGGSNQARPYQSMPVVMGTHRIFPDAASRPYTEYRGENQYLYQIFNLGLGNISASDWKIGTTPITSYTNYEFFTPDSNGKLTQFPGNVDSIAGAALTNAAGWIQRTTSINTYKIGIDIEAILLRIDDKGKIKSTSIDIQIEYAIAGSGIWNLAPTNNYYFDAVSSASAGVFTITAATQKPQRGTIYIDVAPGQYDVRIRRNTADSTNEKVTQNSNFSTLRSYQEDSLTYKGQNRIGLSIKANEQLNGVIQQLSATVVAQATYWNGSAWVTGDTSNPAHWFMHFARGVYNADGKLMYGIGLSESQLDLPALHVWSQFCDTESLTFNAIIDGSQTAADIINIIAKAGFGSPSWASGKLGVVYDAREASPVMTFGMSNIIRNSFEVAYITEQLSDEIVVRFRNPDKDWEQDEVRVTVPGVTDPLSPASIELFGCTNATMAGKFANYLAAQQYYRKRRITWQTDFEGFVCQRGDVVLLSHDLTQWGYSGRLVSTQGLTLYLDRKIPRQATTEYFMLIRPDGQTVTYDIPSGSGEVDSLVLNVFPDLQEGYSVSDHRWCFSPLATPGKKVKIISVAPASDSRLQIVATDEYPEFYNAWGGTFVPPPDSTVLPAQPVTVTNLTAISRTAFVDNILKNRVSLSWGVGGGVLYSRVRIYFDGTLVNEQAQNLTQYYEIDFEGAGAFYAEVTPFGITGAGVTETVSLTLAALDLPSAPTNLQLYAGEDSLSATYTWNEVLGVQSYVIAIYVSGVAVRTQNIGNSLSYTYTVDDAKADGGPFRQYEFRVYSVNQVGQSTSYASVTFSNPQIGALVNARIEPMPNSLWFRCDLPTEPDFQAIRIWLSKTSGFTPSSTTVVYDGGDNWVNIAADNDGNPLESGVVYYVRAAGYDKFGDDNLTTTGEFSAAVLSPAWGLLQDDIETSMLEAGLRDRIDLIDTAGDPDMPNGIIAKVRQDATDISVLDGAVDTIGEKLLESALKIQDNTDLMYDAGVTIDSTTGEVYIYGVRQAENRLDSAEIRLDAAEANINLKASTTYVDSQIALAVIDPSQIADLEDVYARLGNAEVDIDGLQSAITLKADLLTVENQEVRLSSAEVDIDALQSEIVLKASNADLTTTTARVTTVETQINALDVPSITQSVSDVKYIAKQNEQIATTQLRDILTGQANYEDLDYGIAVARNDLTAYTDGKLLAEATARLELAAALSTTQAALVNESIARATADSAEASARLALAATVNDPTTGLAATKAAVDNEIIVRATADSALASSISTLQSTVGGNTTSIQVNAESINGINAKYTVKIDNNGYVSGYGLISTANNGTPTAEFAVIADRFSIAPVATNPDAAPGAPFFVLTAPRVIGGVTVPAGTYIKAAYIHDAAITTAKIADASITNAKILNLDAGKINTGFLSADRISAGSINADKIDSRNLTIKDGSGNIIFSASQNLDWGRITGQPSGIYNSGISIGSNGVLYGAGGGQVSLGGLGAGAFAFISQLNSSNITTYIAGAAIGTALIQNAAITNALIENGAINNAKIADLDAGKINTGTLSADRISTGSLDAKIANIDAAKITSGTIDSARIGNASITTAKIGVAQIDTLRIAGNAVTVSNSVISSASSAIMYFDAPQGGVINVFAYVEGWVGAPNRLQVNVNGTVVLDFDGTEYFDGFTQNTGWTAVTEIAIASVGGGTSYVQVFNLGGNIYGRPQFRIVGLLTQR